MFFLGDLYSSPCARRKRLKSKDDDRDEIRPENVETQLGFIQAVL